MRDVYLVKFSQLRESAETRLNHSDSFCCGCRRPVFNVRRDDIEKCHLRHSEFVNQRHQHNKERRPTFREFGWPARLYNK